MQENSPQHQAQPQPAYVPQQPPQPQPTQPSARQNDGHVVGIIGLVMAFVLLWPVGIILSIISIVQAGKAHASKTLGIVGLVLNILGILTSIILVAITVVAYNGIQARAQTSQDHATANSVASHAEAYYVIEEPVQYPSDLAAFEKYTDTSLSELPSDSVAVQDGTDPTPGVVTYKRCNPESAWVSYYDRSISQAVVIPLGNATSLTVC